MHVHVYIFTRLSYTRVYWGLVRPFIYEREAVQVCNGLAHVQILFVGDRFKNRV